MGLGNGRFARSILENKYQQNDTCRDYRQNEFARFAVSTCLVYINYLLIITNNGW